MGAPLGPWPYLSGGWRNQVKPGGVIEEAGHPNRRLKHCQTLSEKQGSPDTPSRAQAPDLAY